MIWLDSAILVRRSIRRGKGPGSGMSETNESSPEGSESSDRRNRTKRSAFQISRTSVAEQANGESQTNITEIEVPWRTIMRIVMAMALIYFFLQLWTQVVIVFIAIIGFLVFRQSLDIAAVLGIGLIIAGIVVIQLFSNTTMH